MNKLLIVSFVAGIVLISGVFCAEARPEYAKKESKQCGYCHLNPGGGGARGFRGLFYGANNLSFAKFDEKRESALAGVDANAESAKTRPNVAYAGNVTGPRPAANQIQALALRSPVLVAFLTGSSDDERKASRVLRQIALAYGTKVYVVGVVKGEWDQALKVSEDLGSQIRVFADSDGGAARKYGATRALDLVTVTRMDGFKLFAGYSKGNLEAAIAQIGTYNVEAPQGLDLGGAPAEAVHGPKLGN